MGTKRGLCGWDMDGSTSIMGESNPGYGEYTIYDIGHITHRIILINTQ